MSEIKNNLSLSDKENIKQAVLESIAKQSEPAEELAKQACRAFVYIENYPDDPLIKQSNALEDLPQTTNF